jgi:integrase
MASVKALPLGDDGKPRGWKVRYRTPEGVARSQTFLRSRGERKADADRFAGETEHAKRAGTWVDDRLGRVTVREYSEDWLSSRLHRPSSNVRVRKIFRGHVYPTLGDKALAAVKRRDIEPWLKDRSKVLAPNTLHSTWSYVRAMFKAAVLDQAIPFSPCDNIKIGPVPRARVTAPDLADIEAIGAELPDRYAVVALLGAQTGLRPAELLGLGLDQVDFLRRTIRVDRQLRDGVIVKETKTASSVRSVPVGDVTLHLLNAHMAAFPPGPGGEIFTRYDGQGPAVYASVAKAWRRAVARAGVPRVRMHDLRHFNATALIEAGVSPVEVSARLGHAKTSETWDTYAHVSPTHEDTTRAALEHIFGPGARPGRVLGSEGTTSEQGK